LLQLQLQLHRRHIFSSDFHFHLFALQFVAYLLFVDLFASRSFRRNRHVFVKQRTGFSHTSVSR
jgi:hypothetical protein